MGLKSSTGGGEIVQVQGGHIIRATGRKDGHSKVFTAKGPRDRRVRLSAHTAIQFYDVQDRLGYDRPSKAVDWLINKAKESIDKLAELPPWDPTAAIASTTTAVDANVGSSEIPVGDHPGTSYKLHSSSSNATYADSMKSLFPTTNSEDNNPMSFQTYPHDLISRGSNQNQDLCLSLHSNYNHDHHSTTHLLQGSGSLGIDTGPSGWAEQPDPQDMARFTRLMGWAGSGGGGLNTLGQSLPPHALLLSPLVGSTSTYSSERGTLQSSYPQLVRALEDHHQHHHPPISSMGPGSDGFMGFYFPSQIHGELHGGANSISNRASSSS